MYSSGVNAHDMRESTYTPNRVVNPKDMNFQEDTSNLILSMAFSLFLFAAGYNDNQSEDIQRECI